MTRRHEYRARLVWDGNRGTGTSAYAEYDRRYRVMIAGKPELVGTADVRFRGDASLHNPEDLFVAALSGCHMLVYLGLCARRGVVVVAYEDEASGTLALAAEGGGRFTEVVLRPRVTVADAAHEADAQALHDVAHANCFLAASCSVPIRHEPTVWTLAGDPAAAEDSSWAEDVASRPRNPSQHGGGMQDVEIELDHRPGGLAMMGEALGGAGVSIEGGGAFVVNGRAVAHYLVHDGEAARNALSDAGLRVISVRDVVTVRLRQGEPGQLGKLARRMAGAGVNIDVVYSDHDHRLILVVDDVVAARDVAEGWTLAAR